MEQNHLKAKNNSKHKNVSKETSLIGHKNVLKETSPIGHKNVPKETSPIGHTKNYNKNIVENCWKRNKNKIYLRSKVRKEWCELWKRYI